jgi:hypothetical protein
MFILLTINSQLLPSFKHHCAVPPFEFHSPLLASSMLPPQYLDTDVAAASAT